MGLAERRATREFQDNHLPGLLSEIKAVAGMDVPIEIKWDTLAIEDQGHLYNECWKKVYFTPLINALKSITADELGKEALQAGLKKITIQNTTGSYSGNSWASFQAGELILDHLPTTNVDDINDRTNGLVKVLEKGL